VGVNVAVITALPAPSTVSEVPETLITDVVSEEYTNVPGTDPATIGSLAVKLASP
jgi:hypothetical protein